MGPEPASRYIWEAFLRLRRRKAEGPLSWLDIDAFCSRALSLAPWEIELIERLDDAWVEHGRKRSAVPSASAPPQVISAQPMSAKLFDAVFG